MAGAATVGTVTAGHDGYPPVVMPVGSPSVFINGKPALRKGDGGVTHTKPKNSPHEVVVSGGSSTVMINGIPAARIGDPCACGDTLASNGSSNVSVG